MDLPEYMYSTENFDLEAAYKEIKSIFDKVTVENVKKMDLTPLFKRANEIVFALGKCSKELLHNKKDASNIANDLDSVRAFLGVERIDTLKDFVLNSLKDNLIDSIEHEYFVLPVYFEELMNDLIDSCKNDIRKMYKKQVVGAMGKRVEQFIDEISKEAQDGKNA